MTDRGNVTHETYIAKNTCTESEPIIVTLEKNGEEARRHSLGRESAISKVQSV